MQFDELLERLHGFGRYQWCVLLVVCSVCYPVAFNHFTAVFIGIVPPYVCGKTYYPLNSTAARAPDQCFTVQLELDSRNLTIGNQTTKCTEWSYDNSVYKSTIVSEWDLVCDRSWLASLSTSVYMAGLLVGLMPIGILADKVGRRKALLISTTFMTAFMFAVPLSPNIYFFMAFRFLTAFFTQGSASVSYVFALEVVGVNFRLRTNLLHNTPWVLGILIATAIAYLITDWRTFGFVLAGISSFITICLIAFLPESPRWLYATGQTERADVIVRKIAKVNRAEHALQHGFKITIHGKSKANSWQLFRTTKLRKRSLIACYLWFVCSLVYYGLIFNASSLFVDVYINICLAGVLELVGSMILLFLLSTFGRRWPTMVICTLAGVCLFLTMAFDRESWAISALVIIGRMIIGIGFGVAYVYSTEVFPTILRSNGMSAGSVCARIGGMLAPFIGNLNELHPSLSSVIFGITPLIAAVLVYMLPETKGRKLPETIEEIEQGDSMKVPTIYQEEIM